MLLWLWRRRLGGVGLPSGGGSGGGGGLPLDSLLQLGLGVEKKTRSQILAPEFESIPKKKKEKKKNIRFSHWGITGIFFFTREINISRIWNKKRHEWK